MDFNVLHFISTCIFAIICLAIYLYIINTIYGLKFKNKQIVLFLIASGLTTSISSVILMNLSIGGLKAVVSIPFLIVFTLIILKINPTKSFLLAGLYAIIVALASAITSLLFDFLGLDEGAYPVVNFRTVIFAYAIMIAFHLFVAFLIKYFKTYIVLPKEVKGKAFSKGIINLIFVLAILITNFSYYNIGHAIEKPQLFLNIVLILSYFLFSIYNINTSFQLESKRQELEYQVFYNNTLESIMNNLRRFKHNYNNMLAVINGYVMVKRWDELKNYMNEIVQQEKRDSVFNSLMLLKIKNAGLFGIITNKLQYALDKGVDLNVLIEDEISEVGIKISELCEILGILLDNAIEAASESEEKLIRLVVRKIDTSISFSIENSVKEIPDIRKIYEKSYSTKGDGRGMGLWFLNNIIKKNKNIMLNTLTNEKRFKQDLIVS